MVSSSDNNIHLEINLKSCKDLKTFNFFQKLCVFAVTSIGTDVTNLRFNEHQRQEQRTPIDTDGDRFPVWDHSMSFDLSRLPESLCLSDLFLNLDLFHHGNIFGDKLIGSVRIHLKDLTPDHGSDGLRFVDYEVRGPDGKPNGVISFSYKAMRGSHHGTVITGYTVINRSFDYRLQESEDQSRVRYPVIEAQRTLPSAPPIEVVDDQVDYRVRSLSMGSEAAGEAGGYYSGGDYSSPMWHHQPPPPMWGPLPPPPPFSGPHHRPPPFHHHHHPPYPPPSYY